jgi:undecaprenyl diphosphate synthase
MQTFLSKKSKQPSRPEAEVLKHLNRTRFPKHIAIIMDGNGRWAKQRHLPRIFGHRAGIVSVREVVRACGELGIKVLTLYAFSNENWSRPRSETHALMRLLEKYLDRELPELQKNNVQFRHLGRLDALPEGARSRLARTIEETKNNSGLILCLALNYGGRQEIIDACNRLLSKKVESVDEKEFESCLYMPDCPNPDLLIRTSGEFRISNFLLWQLAYTEIHITPVPWPEFRRPHLYQAIVDYQKRERRFGGL